jgi:hypothetical protein
MNTNEVAIITQFGEKIDGYINVLATKAGMAADHFWPLLVHQQVFNGWWGIIQMIFVVILWGLTFKFLYRNLPNDIENDVSSKQFCILVKQFCILVFGGIAIVMLSVAVGVNFSDLGDNFSKINNPEYYAIKSLVTMVK